MTLFRPCHIARTSILLAFLAAITSIAGAQVQRFADDFVGADTDWIDGWNERVGNWRIINHELHPQDQAETGAQVGNQLITHDGITLSHPFRVRADLWSRSNSRWAGVAFHVQDALNQYVLRINFDDAKPQYQFLRMDNGGWARNILGTRTLPVTGGMRDPVGRRYRVEITSATAGDFNIRIFEEQDGQWGEIVNVTAHDTVYSGGVAGAYANGDRTVINNFLLEVGDAAQPAPQGAQFVDQFDGEALKPEWSALVGQWSIVNSELRPEDNEWPFEKILSYQGIALERPFEASTTMWSRTGDRWGGLALNIQDSGTFYAFRLRFSHDTAQAQAQFHLYEGGTSTYFARLSPAFAAADMLDPLQRKYRLVARSGEFGDIHLEVWEEDPTTGTFAQIYRGFLTNYTLTGGHAGVYAGADRIVYSDFQLTVGDPPAAEHPFESWQKVHFTEAELADPQISGPEADPSGDGIDNLVKYALGLNPWEPARQAAPEVIWDVDRPSLTFSAPQERPGIELLLGVSTDLVDWQEYVLDGSYAEWGAVAIDPEREQITARPPEAGQTRLFLRLGVRLLP